MKKVAVMLAGGKGTRLHPISTEEKPKQFLSLLSDQSMLEDSIDRIKPIFDPESIFINSIDKYRGYVKKLPYQAIIEPHGVGTTASVLFNVLELMDRYEDCVISLIPSDHYIGDDDLYRNTLLDAIDIASNSDNVVLIGINPTEYETGYGYINHKHGMVVGFNEKPDYELAKKYVDNGYLWNSGIFVFKASVMYRLYRELKHDFRMSFEYARSLGSLKGYYENVQIKPDSFEKAIIEKTNRLAVVKAHFDWSDIGDLSRYIKIMNKEGREKSWLEKLS